MFSEKNFQPVSSILIEKEILTRSDDVKLFFPWVKNIL